MSKKPGLGTGEGSRGRTRRATPAHPFVADRGHPVDRVLLGFKYSKSDHGP